MRKILTKNKEIAYGFFESYEEAQKFSDKNNGDIVLFEKQKGSKEWEKVDYQWGPIVLTPENFGEEYKFITYDDTKEDVVEAFVKPKLEELYSNIDDLYNFVSYWKEIVDDMEELKEDEAFLMKEENGKYKKIDTIKVEGTLMESDKGESLIGVVLSNEVNIDDEE